MNKHKFPFADYGLVSDLSVDQDTEKHMIFLKGTGAKSNQWAHQTTLRAVHQLWFSLTHLLFPEKANQVTSMAATAVMSIPRPGITTFFEASYDPEMHFYQIIGWVGEGMWTFHVNDDQARHLWTVLDLLIYPAGWEGTATKY